MTESAAEWLTLLGLPLLGGILALVTHLPLGEQVLRRGVVFVDLAIAQVSALGVLIGLPVGDIATQPQWAATAAALWGAGLVAVLVRIWPRQREALIGLIYVGAAAAAVLMVSNDPHGAQKLRALLAGDILWAQWRTLVPLALAAGALAALLTWRPKALERDAWFYPAFATVISLSVPLLGLYLIFAVLIAPALGALRLREANHRRAGLLAAAAGLVGFVLGLLASFWLDQPSGPCIVLALIVCAAGLHALSPALITRQNRQMT